MSQVREVYFGGEKITFTRELTASDGYRLTGTGEWDNRFWAWERFSATGNLTFPTGADAPDLSDDVGGVFPSSGQPAVQWGAEHKGVGFSGLVCHFRSKVGKRKKPEPSAEKAWHRFPTEFEVVVDGNLITWPGQTTPTFTRNPIAHIAYILTTRGWKRPPRKRHSRCRPGRYRFTDFRTLTYGLS